MHAPLEPRGARPDQTPHSIHLYAPEPQRKGIALCLSGGGFRASLFHLGALRRLNELDILSQLTTVTAVSGGSAVAAHLANLWDHWHAGPCPADEWERVIAAPFREFTSRNLSTPPALKGLRPWNWVNNTGVEELAKACAPLCRMNVQDLPERPNFMFCATDLVSGTPFVFERSSDRPWTVGQAVAISSCFPGVFRPYTESKPRYIKLVDGGVADNRGVEPVWQTHETLLVSDGGDALRPQWDESFFWALSRSAAVLLNQMQLVQKRWLLANMLSGATRGAYWGLGSVTRHYRRARQHRIGHVSRHRRNTATPYLGYSETLVRDTIATIRLDFDVFSEAEAAVLENHGYLLADAATRTHLRSLRRPAPLRIPHPAWLSDQKVREALRDSSHKLLLGRGAFRAVFGAAREPISRRHPVRQPTASAKRRLTFVHPEAGD